MPDEQPISQQPPESAASQATQTLVHEPPAEPGDWLPDEEELPARPRRRLLAPLPLSLLGLLLIACGFIGGVLVEKGQSSGASSSGAGSGAGLAARFAALRAGSGGGSATPTGGAGLSAGSGGPGGATVGQVSFISSGTLYVTTAEGNTVKVTPSPGATITKTVKSDVKGIHPGETVLVTGAANATGAVSAESIRASASVAGGGGLGALLGGGGSGGGGAGGKSGSGAGGGPVLFGPGG